MYAGGPIEDPKMLNASDLQQHITEVIKGKIHTLNSNVLCVEQKWNITCKTTFATPS